MKRISLFFLVLTVVLSFFSTSTNAGVEPMKPGWLKHDFTFKDMIKMKRLSQAEVSPDGKWVVFVSSEYSLDTNKSKKNLWLVSIDGETKKQLTSSDKPDFNPQWSPDGKVYFLSTRSGSVQIWMIDPNGGEATQITDYPLDIEMFKFSPDGSQFSLVFRVFTECETLKCNADKLKELEDSPVKAKIYDKLMVRHWDTWKDGRVNHIFITPVGSKEEPKDLMKGINADSPTVPWGGLEEFNWSPDGKEIAYTATIDPNPAWTTNYDIFTVDVLTDERKNISESNKAWDAAPFYSKDGKYLFYKAMSRPGFEADKFSLVLVERATGKSEVLLKDWQYSPSELVIADDNQTIYMNAPYNGEVAIFSYGLTDGKIKEIVSEGYNRNIMLTNDRLVYMHDTFTSPAEIFVSTLEGSSPKDISNVNTELVESIKWGKVQKFTFSGYNDEEVQGWYITPPDFKEGQKYPLAFIIHGGPQGAVSNHFHYRWNSEIYAGAGYVVVAINFHGSVGFGQDFTDAITGHWHDRPYEDLMKGLDYAISEFKSIDEERMCALGASFGGYMVNWINGQTDRFKCLVNHDGIFNEESGYYTTEELWFPEWEHGGPAYEVPENYKKASPHTYVKNWKTPTLVIHGEYDYRLPVVEGIATFNALQRKGIPSKFLYFPDENHWVLKPKNSELWHNTVLDWMGEYTK